MASRWVGAFNAISAFNNSGMSLLDANMTAFQTAYYMLLTMGLCILAGNTCYPIFLRLIMQHAEVPARPPATLLHQPVPLRAHMVAGAFRRHAQRRRLGGL